MIELTRLNGTPIVLNSDLIKTAEASPDTMLTLINGEKLIVREDTARGRGTGACLPRPAAGGGAKRLPSFGESAARGLADQPGSFRPAKIRFRQSKTIRRHPESELRFRTALHKGFGGDLMDKGSVGGVLLAVAGHHCRIADRRRQSGADSAADRGPDSLWRHYGGGPAPVSPSHGGRGLRSLTHVFSAPANRMISCSACWSPLPTRPAATALSRWTAICKPSRILFSNRR